MESDNKTTLRDENGRLLPGTASANPEGKNGYLKGYQRFGDRAAYLQSLYTRKQIVEMASSLTALDDLPFQDAQIIHHLARTMTGDDQRLTLETVLNRMEGKPQESSNIQMIIKDEQLTESERAAKLTALSDKARARRAGQDTAGSGEVGTPPLTDTTSG